MGLDQSFPDGEVHESACRERPGNRYREELSGLYPLSCHSGRNPSFKGEAMKLWDVKCKVVGKGGFFQESMTVHETVKASTPGMAAHETWKKAKERDDYKHKRFEQIIFVVTTI